MKRVNFGITYNSINKKVEISNVEDRVGIDPLLIEEIDLLNRFISDIDQANIDLYKEPGSLKVNKEVNKQIKKSYVAGLLMSKNGKYSDAIKCYSSGINQIFLVNVTEPFKLFFHELNLLLNARADVYIKMNNYLHAYNDIDFLLNLLIFSLENFLKKGQCLFLMKKYDQALYSFERGLSFENRNSSLMNEIASCKQKILKNAFDSE